MYRIWNFVSHYSLLLLLGAGIGLVWANLDSHSYHALLDYEILNNSWIGALQADSGGMRVLTPHYLINDVFMALFFAIAGKEVWEAVILKEAPLRGKRAFVPLIATLGGMLGPVLVYLSIAALLGAQTFDILARGWAIPTATDIAFSYLIGRIIFGANHPALRFLLLLAIADDAGGLIILALFYPTSTLAPMWILVSFFAAAFVFLIFNALPRRLDRGRPERPVSTWFRKKLSVWAFVVAGCVSWFAFQKSGIHPALGLLPIIPTIPHADRSFGIFAAAEKPLKDLLNVLEHNLAVPAEFVLFAFGFANAGVEFSAIGPATWIVLLGLLIGKPLGIFCFGWFAAKPLKLGLPVGMTLPDLFVLGCVAAIGFTVALFVASVAFPVGPVQDAAKMGALFSFSAAAFALLAGKLFGIRKK